MAVGQAGLSCHSCDGRFRCLLGAKHAAESVVHSRQLVTNGSSRKVLVNCTIVFAMFLILYLSAGSSDVDWILGLSTQARIHPSNMKVISSLPSPHYAGGIYCWRALARQLPILYTRNFNMKVSAGWKA